jgi:double-stranded uracil-DNA glycosylase
MSGRGEIVAPHNVAGLPPIAGADATVLVLGSALSVLSLQKGEYYGNPQNAFWRIMAELLGRPPGGSYAARRRLLIEARLALWDVLASAERPGSLDASIVATTAVVNDFEAFFAGHPLVRAVFFNGQTARRFWDRRVQGRQALPAGLALITLPSTSPANAARTIEEKTAAWQQVVEAAGGPAGRREVAGRLVRPTP